MEKQEKQETEVDFSTGSDKNLNFQGFTLVFWQKVGENGVSKW